MSIITIASIAREARCDGTPRLWAGSEPIWPADYAGGLWDALSLFPGAAAESPSWPVAMSEICGESMEPGSRDGDAGVKAILLLLRNHCQEKIAFHPFGIAMDAGAYPLERKYPLGRPFEQFNPGWGSVLVDAEIARAWNRLPPAVNSELRYPVSPRSYVYFRLGLRRDLSAWHGDAIGSNLPLSGKEVDLNEPSLGYFRAENEAFSLTIGRFPVHWSPSPDFGLALSHAVPFHNAAEFSMRMMRVRYRFLASSLNPWLEGTPTGDSSSVAYPYGSEEYRQRHYPADGGAGNFHKRIYDARVKTLFAHRLEGDLGRLKLGITETQIIGGKVPDLRDAGPFVFFHNDFKDGYTNSALSFDGSLRLGAGFSLLAEWYLDDARFSETEGEGATASVFGYLGAVRHAFTFRGWGCTQSLHAVRTDPFLYGYLQPLSTMASRHSLASNNQQEGAPVFVDRYVVDYPMGYLRGGDAYDLWYRLDVRARSGLRLSLSAALLAKGRVDLHTPFEEYYSGAHDSPTGTAEREVRLGLSGEFPLARGVSVHGGLGWQSLRNQGNSRGNDAVRGQASFGIAWTAI